MPDDLLHQAIHEPVQILAHNPAYPTLFQQEKSRLLNLFPELTQIEHFGSTAVPNLPAKPIIDLLTTVPSLQIADSLIPRLCDNGYTTSAEFNATLPDRRWLMRHSAGRRTHHLHLLLPNSPALQSSLRFRDLLRASSTLAAEYAALKQSLAQSHPTDREAYTVAKSDFIQRVLARVG